MKKLVALLLCLMMVVPATLASAETAEGKVLNIWCWNDEFQSRFNAYYPEVKEIAEDKSTTFLNCLEFADTHTVNGKEMAAVVDDNELLERDKAKIMAAQTEGTYKARRLVYVAKADFGPRPAQGAMLTLDGKAYKVKSCTEEAGVLAIELEAVRS